MNLKEIFDKEITIEEKIIYYYTIYKEEQNKKKKIIILGKLKKLLAEYASWMN
mgnify:FL=1